MVSRLFVVAPVQLHSSGLAVPESGIRVASASLEAGRRGLRVWDGGLVFLANALSHSKP